MNIEKTVAKKDPAGKTTSINTLCPTKLKIKKISEIKFKNGGVEKLDTDNKKQKKISTGLATPSPLLMYKLRLM